MSNRVIGELTSPEIAIRIRDSSILCLPLGSIEQHGPHLPLDTDVVVAEGVTRRIVTRWGDSFDLWQLPTVLVYHSYVKNMQDDPTNQGFAYNAEDWWLDK